MAHEGQSEIQWVNNTRDLDSIVFTDDVARIQVPIEAVKRLPFKNEDRGDSDRLKTVIRSIRQNGYNNFDPIIVRIGRRGRWVIVDGGHRLTAAQIVAREFWANLFRKKVHSIYFLLFRTPLSNTRIDEPPESSKS